MEFLALAVFLAVFGLVLARLSRHPIAWLRNEWRLMRADSWEEGPIVARRPTSGTVEDPRCQKMLHRQQALAQRMRKKGRHLYSGKQYRPALTSPAPETPAEKKNAGVVIDLVRKQR